MFESIAYIEPSYTMPDRSSQVAQHGQGTTPRTTGRKRFGGIDADEFVP